MAYADDYRFHPDPVLYYEIPEDGEYVLEIKDAIYRGREDFVYRITLGELPFVTSIFPLGGRAGAQTTVELKGWNLPAEQADGERRGSRRPGSMPISICEDVAFPTACLFAVDTLPECLEAGTERPRRQSAQQVEPPMIVNGRIDRPGDWDVFRFQGRARRGRSSRKSMPAG